MQQNNEAVKCLELAKKKFSENDLDGAIRLAKKAKRMDSSLNVDSLLSEWTKEEDIEIKITDKQERMIQRILGTNPTDFYSILELDKSCSETEIKKAYRKMALHLHPDKCPDPRAQEAFLKVSKAFSILSDETKKQMYDRNGLDPEDRSAGHSQYQRSQHMREAYSMDDILAEQIFAQFFGMANGAQFHSFNANNMRRRHFNVRPQRQQQPRQEDTSITRYLIQLVPLFLFIALSVLPALLKVKQPQISLNPVRGFQEYTTPLQFHYYAASNDINRFVHQGGDLDGFEHEVDDEIVGRYRKKCQQEREYKERQLSMASSTWFGLKDVDKPALQRARDIKLPSCVELSKRGLNF